MSFGRKLDCKTVELLDTVACLAELDVLLLSVAVTVQLFVRTGQENVTVPDVEVEDAGREVGGKSTHFHLHVEQLEIGIPCEDHLVLGEEARVGNGVVRRVLRVDRQALLTQLPHLQLAVQTRSDQVALVQRQTGDLVLVVFQHQGLALELEQGQFSEELVQFGHEREEVEALVFLGGVHPIAEDLVHELGVDLQFRQLEHQLQLFLALYG